MSFVMLAASGGHLTFVTPGIRVCVAATACTAALLASCTTTAQHVVHPAPTTRAVELAEISGQLWTAHGAGLILTGYGSVAGTVTITGAVRKVVAASAAQGFRVALPPGAYRVTGTIRFGLCKTTTLTVTSPAPQQVTVSCVDGFETD